jgi:hypothetical protein
MSRNPPPGLALVERTADAARGATGPPIDPNRYASGSDEAAYRARRGSRLPAHRFVGRPISASGLASPKLVGERRREHGVARGVPPPGIFPADLDGRFENHVLHHFRAATPARSVISEPRIGAARSAAR